MTKSERLLFLIRLLRGRGGVSLRELAARCNVSSRTLYRDLRTLGRQGYAVVYRHGYRLNRPAGRVLSGLSSDDIGLVRLALRTSPLVRSPWMMKRFQLVDAELSASEAEIAPVSRPSSIVLNGDFRPIDLRGGDEVISRLMQGMLLGRRVTVVGVDTHPHGPLRPIRLRIGSDSARVILINPKDGGQIELAVGEILKVRLSGK